MFHSIYERTAFLTFKDRLGEKDARHTKDQIRPFMNGDMVFWWFSDEAIRANASKSLELLPAEEGS